jgi:hypothetical protein
MMFRAHDSLTRKSAALFGIFSRVVSGLICWITYASDRDSMLEHYGKYAFGAATLAVSGLDTEELFCSFSQGALFDSIFLLAGVRGNFYPNFFTV